MDATDRSTAGRIWSVGVAVVDVREMFVLVADGTMSVLRSREHLDRV